MNKKKVALQVILIITLMIATWAGASLLGAAFVAWMMALVLFFAILFAIVENNL